MPDERGPRALAAAARRASAALLGALCLLAPVPARSQNLRGYVQLQYQKLQNGRDLDLNFNREYWVTSFQVNYATELRSDLSLTSQVQFTNLDYTGRSEGSRQPYLSLRLLHPWAGFYGAYRPTSQTDIAGNESKQEQTVLSAYWNRPKWPRLDLSWIHRQLDQGGISGSGTTRYALLGYTLGGLTVHGGYSDESNQPDQAPEKQVIQRAWTGGAVYAWARPTANLLLQYDFTDNQRGDPSSNTNAVQTQTVNLNGGKRFSARNDATVSYLYRLTKSQNTIDQTYHDQETALMFNHHLSPPVVLSAGAGGRTLRTGLVNNFETYVLGTATASGRLRQHWNGMAGVTYSINWLENGQPYAANTYTVSTIMGLRPGIDVNGGANVSLNGRPALAVSDSSGNSVAGRVSSQLNFGATLTPRRTFTLGYLFTGTTRAMNCSAEPPAPRRARGICAGFSSRRSSSPATSRTRPAGEAINRSRPRPG